jgi:hypothetical protein
MPNAFLQQRWVATRNISGATRDITSVQQEKEIRENNALISIVIMANPAQG